MNSWVVELAAWIIVLSVAVPLGILVLGGLCLAVFRTLEALHDCLVAGGNAVWDLIDWLVGRPVGWTPPEQRREP